MNIFSAPAGYYGLYDQNPHGSSLFGSVLFPFPFPPIRPLVLLEWEARRLSLPLHAPHQKKSGLGWTNHYSPTNSQFISHETNFFRSVSGVASSQTELTVYPTNPIHNLSLRPVLKSLKSSDNSKTLYNNSLWKLVIIRRRLPLHNNLKISFESVNLFLL